MLITHLERPYQSAIVLLLSPGLVILFLRFSFPSLFVASQLVNRGAAIPLRNRISSDEGREESSEPPGSPISVSGANRRRLFVAITAAVCCRVEIFRLILHNRQCTIAGVDVNNPLAFKVNELLTMS